MKDRLTLLMCGNANGDFKVKPLLVYHLDNRRVFKRNNVMKSKLPVLWMANAEAWFTRQCFNEWLHEVFVDIQSFLVLRKQQVIVEGESSKPCSVDSGVPQGSVLGTLLFLCHINDPPQRVTSTVRLFADDCLLYKPIHSSRDQLLLQQDLAAL